MKDAFGKTLNIGSKVLYSSGAVPVVGVLYHIGTVVKLYPEKGNIPNKVQIEVSKSSWRDPAKNPITYASNVVLLPVESE